jgi:hypothetical protein
MVAPAKVTPEPKSWVVNTVWSGKPSKVMTDAEHGAAAPTSASDTTSAFKLLVILVSEKGGITGEDSDFKPNTIRSGLAIYKQQACRSRKCLNIVTLVAARRNGLSGL